MTTTQNPDTVIKRLEQQLADLQLTHNTQDTFWHERAQIDGRLHAIRRPRERLAELTPKIAHLEKWHAHLTDWLEKLERPVVPAAGPRAYTVRLSIRVLQYGLGALTDTGLMLETLPLGDLMRQSGFSETEPAPPGETGNRLPWHGSLLDVEQRLKALIAERDDEQVRLERALAS